MENILIIVLKTTRINATSQGLDSYQECRAGREYINKKIISDSIENKLWLLTDTNGLENFNDINYNKWQT